MFWHLHRDLKWDQLLSKRFEKQQRRIIHSPELPAIRAIPLILSHRNDWWKTHHHGLPEEEREHILNRPPVTTISLHCRYKELRKVQCEHNTSCQTWFRVSFSGQLKGKQHHLVAKQRHRRLCKEKLRQKCILWQFLSNRNNFNKFELKI